MGRLTISARRGWSPGRGWRSCSRWPVSTCLPSERGGIRWVDGNEEKPVRVWLTGTALFGAAGLLLAGCAGGPPPSDTLVLAIPSEGRTPDPARGYDTYSVAGVHALASSLLDYDEQTNLRPDLAASWSASPDRRRYAFTLRPGIRFSNGQPVTSGDVKFALERVLNPATGSPGASFYRIIEGAPDYIRKR